MPLILSPSSLVGEDRKKESHGDYAGKGRCSFVCLFVDSCVGFGEESERTGKRSRWRVRSTKHRCEITVVSVSIFFVLWCFCQVGSLLCVCFFLCRFSAIPLSPVPLTSLFPPPFSPVRVCWMTFPSVCLCVCVCVCPLLLFSPTCSLRPSPHERRCFSLFLKFGLSNALSSFFFFSFIHATTSSILFSICVCSHFLCFCESCDLPPQLPHMYHSTRR
jgi:hypothetical protein